MYSNYIYFCFIVGVTLLVVNWFVKDSNLSVYLSSASMLAAMITITLLVVDKFAELSERIKKLENKQQ